MPLGLFGKLPTHGDFVRRGGLPASFLGPWDAWLQEGIAAARAAIGEARWEAVWDAAPAWRFALPPGACGPGAVAGVMLPSRDLVGRRFPLTLAAVSAEADPDWPGDWFAALEGVAREAIALGRDADGLAALLPAPTAPAAGAATGPAPADPLAAFWASVAAEDALEHAAAEEHAASDGDGSPAEPGANEAIETDSPPPDDAAMMPDGKAGRVTPGWWTAAAPDGTPGLVWPLPALPPAAEFALLLESEA